MVDLSFDQTRTVGQMKAFVAGTDLVDIAHLDGDGGYAPVTRSLERAPYVRLGEADRGVVLRFLEKAMGLSWAQTTHLVRRHSRIASIWDHRNKPPARPFTRRYTNADPRSTRPPASYPGWPTRRFPDWSTRSRAISASAIGPFRVILIRDRLS